MTFIKIGKKSEKKDEPVLELPKAASNELGISEEASLWVARLMKDSHKPFLRVSIRGGGCSGLTIHYELSDQKRSDDTNFAQGEALVVIDKKSLSVLGGATLHCREYLGAKELFLANNPAEKQCSCGQSFSL